MNLAELQQAVYDTLSNDANVSGAVVGIYTDTPDAAQSESDGAFPFIVIGPFIASPYDDKGANGVEVLADIHLFSRSTSALEWREVTDDIYAAMQKYDGLPVSDANVIDCRFDGSQDFRDPDGKTTHSVLTFRIVYFLL